MYSIVVGDEQALLIHSDKGGVLIAGCAHPGIVNMIRKAKEVTKGDILAAMGGFHLQGNFGEVSTSEIETTVSSFKDLGVRYVGATHCSGNEARRLFKENYKEHYLDLGTGKVLMVKESKVNTNPPSFVNQQLIYRRGKKGRFLGCASCVLQTESIRLRLLIVCLATSRTRVPALSITIRSLQLPLKLVPNYDLKIEDFDTRAETW